jgi:hypothetical protein
VELTYTLFVGDCDHSTGGYHGAGVKEIQRSGFLIAVLVDECALTE